MALVTLVTWIYRFSEAFFNLYKTKVIPDSFLGSEAPAGLACWIWSGYLLCAFGLEAYLV